MKWSLGSGPARPGVKPCRDATWMLVLVTQGITEETRAATKLEKSILIWPIEKFQSTRNSWRMELNTSQCMNVFGKI